MKKPAPRMIVRAGFFVALFAAQAFAQESRDFAAIAKQAGEPQVPGLTIVYLSKLGNPAEAPWRHVIAHQTEGPPGSARALAQGQAAQPTKRGVTLWVETDGTAYWS